MTLSGLSRRTPAFSADSHAVRPVELVCFGMAVAYLVFLAAAFANGIWFVDKSGYSIQNDFVNVWAAGRLALEGHPAGIYDWDIHKDAEVAAVGHEFTLYYGWHYPPPFLFVAALLALIPYNAAFLIWMALTLPAYAAAVRHIIGHRIGFLLAAAFPPVLWNVSVGQNGFMTAALLGGALGVMQRRPVLAGVFLGLLTYKPQFGILFPLVLAASGRWRVFGTAAAVGSALAGASWLAFGTVTWRAFFDSIPLTALAVFSDGQAGLWKLQSVFGLVRALGGSEALAYGLHGALTAAIALALFILWRSETRFELKAAALATGALLVTPYLYIYDLVVLAVPMAFLIRLGFAEGFRLFETAGLMVAALLLLAYPMVPAPTGLIATLIVAVLIAKRIVRATSLRTAVA
jgi:hypothetical protein